MFITETKNNVVLTGRRGFFAQVQLSAELGIIGKIFEPLLPY
jgi:hypothetical protein